MISPSTQSVQDRLSGEFERLYGLQAWAEAKGVSQDDSRALILQLSKPSEWSSLAVLWHAFVSEWGMPAPAIAVNGRDGIQLWFSLFQPVSRSMCERFLMALRERFLDGLPQDRVSWYPSSEPLSEHGDSLFTAVPACMSGTDHWSAFVTRDLAAVFGDEPWVDVPPVRDQQAEILSRLSPMTRAQMDFVLEQLDATNSLSRKDAAPYMAERSDGSDRRNGVGPPSEWRGPAEFLWAAMNNTSLPMGERIEAAKALLPYPESHWKRG